MARSTDDDDAAVAVDPGPNEPLTALRRELELRVLRSGQLSPNDDQVLSFLQEHLEELAFHTSESIAQGSGVSRAAVVRFARRLGFAGFAELRARGRAAIRARDEPAFAGGHAQASLLERKLRRDAQNLGLLPGLLEQSLPAAVVRLAGAEHIWVLASRETHGLALYFHHLLHHVRAGVRLVDPAFPDALRDGGAADAVLACTFRPYARQTVDLLGHVHRATIPAVVLTDAGDHPFLVPDDVVLTVPVDSPTMFLSFTAAVGVLEALAAQVARADVDRTHRTLAATDRFVAGQRLTVRSGSAIGRAASRSSP